MSYLIKLFFQLIISKSCRHQYLFRNREISFYCFNFEFGEVGHHTTRHLNSIAVHKVGFHLSIIHFSYKSEHHVHLHSH